MSYTGEERPQPVLPLPAVPSLQLLHAGAQAPEPPEWMVRAAQVAFETKLSEMMEADMNRRRLEAWQSRRAVRFADDEPMPSPKLAETTETAVLPMARGKRK